MANARHVPAALAHGLWCVNSLRAWSTYGRALRDPEAVQRAQLLRYLGRNAGTAFGIAHGFGGIRTVREFRERVPLRTYDDFRPWISRIMAGEQRVLTRSAVSRLTSSSGSTSAAKYLPSTGTLQDEFARAVGPWVVDLYRTHRGLAWGRSYWSITPAVRQRNRAVSAVPIGFEDDTAYLGGWLSRLVSTTLAVPDEVRLIGDVESFRYATLLFLLRTSDLRLISVWHPSFLVLLLEALRPHWDALLHDLRCGTLTPPTPLPAGTRKALTPRLRRAPQRARELERAGPDCAEAIWPALQVISCWTDGHAAAHFAELRRLFPTTVIQGKGLIATEAIVTLPFAGARPLAVCSHFFEFLDEHQRPLLAHELQSGGSYSVVVTTGGGLYRYRLADRVEVDGAVAGTPSLRFVGKEDHVSDLAGEKLSEGFVGSVVRELCERHGMTARFAMLAPETRHGRPGYVLILEVDAPPPTALADDLEAALRMNPHYDYAMHLGQLTQSRILHAAPGAYATYAASCQALGMRLGDIKPAALTARVGWADRFHAAPHQQTGDAASVVSSSRTR